jgi:hypothetical protein
MQFVLEVFVFLALFFVRGILSENDYFPLPIFSSNSIILPHQYVWLIIVFLINLLIQIITLAFARVRLFTPLYIIM